LFNKFQLFFFCLEIEVVDKVVACIDASITLQAIAVKGAEGWRCVFV
jgi:hypothetical protein